MPYSDRVRPSHSSPLSYHQYLFTLARDCAGQHRLSPSDAEDCAIVFVEKMCVEQALLLKQHQHSPGFTVWLNVCARNHVRDYCRQQARVCKIESPLPEQEILDSATLNHIHDEQCQPCAFALRSELKRRLERAATELTPEARSLFLRHFVVGATFAELARETSSTPDAVRMVVQRARKHLRETLQRQGMTEEDAKEYLAELAGGDDVKIWKNQKSSVRFLCGKSFLQWKRIQRPSKQKPPFLLRQKFHRNGRLF